MYIVHTLTLNALNFMYHSVNVFLTVLRTYSGYFPENP